MHPTLKPPDSRRPGFATGNIYADLSGYYDQFCAEVNYIEQCAFAERVFLLFAPQRRRDYLDLACGTGQHLQNMEARGFLPHGLDNSAAMLARAAVRCPGASLLLCDMAAFDQVAVYDLITCFLYSIHYSHPTAALSATLRRTWDALKPGGIFIFNAVDADGIRNHTGVTTRLTDGDSQLTFNSSWHYRGTGDVLDLALAITRETTGERQEWCDHHTMTAITLPQLMVMLEDIGFEVTLLEHDYAVMSEWSGTSFNGIFVACKPL
jgi:SAM-dependent methyltransferase